MAATRPPLSHQDSHNMRCLTIPSDLKSSILAELANDPNTSADNSLQTTPVTSRPASPPPKSDIPASDKSKPAPATVVKSKLAHVQTSEDLEKDGRDGNIDGESFEEDMSPMRTHDLDATDMEPVAKKVSRMVAESDSEDDDTDGDAGEGEAREGKKSKRKRIGETLKRTFTGGGKTEVK